MCNSSNFKFMVIADTEKQITSPTTFFKERGKVKDCAHRD